MGLMAYAHNMKRTALILSLFVLAGCANPRQDCIDDATKDLRIVQGLIADTEATLERGYAIQTETRTVLYTDFCIGTGIRNGHFSFCNRAQPVTSRTPVAVDLSVERKKLLSLKRKEAELKARSANNVQRCELAHPTTK